LFGVNLRDKGGCPRTRGRPQRAPLRYWKKSGKNLKKWEKMEKWALGDEVEVGKDRIKGDLRKEGERVFKILFLENFCGPRALPL